MARRKPRRSASPPRSRWKKDVLVGTPAQITEQLQPFLDLGVEYLIVRLVDFPSHAGMDLFTQEVMPRLRAAQGA